MRHWQVKEKQSVSLLCGGLPKSSFGGVFTGKKETTKTHSSESCSMSLDMSRDPILYLAELGKDTLSLSPTTFLSDKLERDKRTVNMDHVPLVPGGV